KNSKSGFFFLIIAVVAISCSGNGKKTEAKKVLPETKPSYVEVSIAGMTCTGCEQTIQKRVTDLEGVKSVKASFSTGKAIVEYFPEMTDTAEIKNAITGSGYKVKKFTPVSGSSSSTE
ncbi:MAG: cation transporter, partial [Methanococcaceae archaeon]